MRNTRPGGRSLAGQFRSYAGNPDAFGSERSFKAQIGRHWSPSDPVRGSYIDFRFKADTPQWPPEWLGSVARQHHVATAQWGLGAYEHFANGEGDAWLRAALQAGEHLLGLQHRGGPQDGGWRHFFRMPHTYEVEPPWLSGITQGEAATLLVRLYRQTGDDRLAEAARRALLSMSVPVADGGLLGSLDGAPFVEEYPTNPPSFVLNGAIFALWGFHDVGVGLGDSEALERFELLTSALAAHLDRWDAGYWSRYDLYPHPVANIASPAYHKLHIQQLEIIDQLSSRPAFREVRSRFQDYRGSAACRRRALAEKVAFRLVVPRNPALAHRLPWSTAARRDERPKRPGDVLVLCYHAVSTNWSAPLSITPEQLDSQLGFLASKGFRAVTLSDAIRHRGEGKRVAITFDDGYRSVYRLAKPILDAHGMLATVFVPTDFVGIEQPMSWPGIDRWLNGPHAAELTPMSWEEARDLTSAGWEIGSHTCSHPRLTEIGDEQLRGELEESRAECERRLDHPCESLAFPYGDVDQRVMEGAMSAGYSVAVCVAPRIGQPSPYCWPRVGVYHVDSDRSFRLKTSLPLRRLQRSRAWGPTERVFRLIRSKGNSARAAG